MPSSSQADSPPASMPRLLHPLMGCDLVTLLRVLGANGGVPPRCWPHAGLAIATALGRLPFTALESFWVARQRRRTPNLPPPLFIVGHWRSGTTFLYEILCQSPQFAYVSPFATGLPWEFLTLGRVLRPWLERALPSDRFIDSMQVLPHSPQEDEIGLANMQPLSFYHGLYFPSRLRQNFDAGIFFDGCSDRAIAHWQEIAALFFEKLQYEQPGKQLLIKNPVYTARVALLRQMYPGAKFIHIYRNPYIVFQSTRNFYTALFKELALQPFAAAPVDTLILESYPRMMTALLEDTQGLPPDQFIELRFETFEADPLAAIAQIYQQLELEGFAAARPNFAAYLEANQRYRKNRYQFPQADNDRVGEYWQVFCDRWNYQPPV
ncbi:MAG: sulfotransferase [Synechococcales bacterium]|nr:sulfotransferase [Synechococcales bacterium]